MKVTFIPIVIGALGTDTKELLKGREDLGIRGRVTRRDKYLDLARTLKKAVEHYGDGDASCSWHVWKLNWKSWKSKDESSPLRLKHC